MKKKDVLDDLKDAFCKNKVFDMEQLKKAIHTTSRRTVFRYLQKLHCLTSYTHKGKYYTIPKIAQFDKDGFWHFGDIGFSEHGTLMDTLIHVITMSEAGKTNSELEKYFRTRVQNSLQNLLKSNKITKAIQAKPCLYVSSDPEVSDRQIKRRKEMGSRKRLPDWIVSEILIETIRSFPRRPEINDVIKRLSKGGSLITYAQVKQVFEENDLEKKTSD
jgi:hypothetical protein